MSTKTKKSDNGHNGNNHVKQDGGKRSKCTVCQRTECPRTRKKPCEHKKDFSKPSCPAPTKPLGGATVVFLDSEFQHYPDAIGGRKRRTIMEIGAVAAKPDSKKGKWEQVGDEFDQPIRVKRFNMKLIGIMKQEKMKERCIKEGVDVKDGFQNLLTYLKGLPGDSKVFKGHNFIPSDMRHMIEHLKYAGVEDPIKDLERVGIAGIADGMRFIPKHKELSHLRGEKKDPKTGNMKAADVLGNGELYRKAAGCSMEARDLRPHRALDDAKAEMFWTTDKSTFAAVTDVMMSEKLTVVTMAQYRAYHEQYEKRENFLESIGTL